MLELLIYIVAGMVVSTIHGALSKHWERYPGRMSDTRDVVGLMVVITITWPIVLISGGAVLLAAAVYFALSVVHSKLYKLL